MQAGRHLLSLSRYLDLVSARLVSTCERVVFEPANQRIYFARFARHSHADRRRCVDSGSVGPPSISHKDAHKDNERATVNTNAIVRLANVCVCVCYADPNLNVNADLSVN